MPVPPPDPPESGQPTVSTPASNASGTMSRDLLNDDKAHKSFKSARDKIQTRVQKEDEDTATKAGAAEEGKVRGDELFEQFDLDKFLEDSEQEAQDFEADIIRANEFDKIRKEGLTDEQKTKLDEIKQRVLERNKATEKGGDVSGTPNQDTPAKAPETPITPDAGQPNAAGGSIVPPVPATEGQPAGAAETPPVVEKPPVPSTPPTTEQTPATEAITADKLTEAVTDAVNKQIEPLKVQLAETNKENDTLKEQLAKAEEVTKDVIDQRDKLKQQTNFNRFSAAATEAGIPKDLHKFAQQKAQELVDEANESGEVQGQMSFSAIFELMKEKAPSFFNKDESPNETQIKPGATGTGESSGGKQQETSLTKREPATTFEEAHKNLKARLAEM